MKKDASYHILRIAVGITFVWIGILIFQSPEAWGGFVEPWVENLLPLPLKDIMLATAAVDVVIGFFLLVDVYVWIFGFLGALHLATVLITSGITAVTVRDIGLLGGLIAITLVSWKTKAR
ncbi:MAG: hypothetical protein COU47_02585 [Candidatus Niyogibacteria bacterium CG10_big_fil_rev_8_21_14_0_10_46_36]|uniref:DoxX family protein n=1 Tax=Candidatus Niyogibacteria bacterium CG10_big_fil_rev_8_21_14_0_10_46_36 TaxID=1974726 RepID=A0A2H0TDK0_9BACT|nr:MAG: hypothetical protein COU47_02585 [Candidatus Niyogibacteria bacterium CG10_big_fil_rev_8_21_14_0_10_46_36]